MDICFDNNLGYFADFSSSENVPLNSEQSACDMAPQYSYTPQFFNVDRINDSIENVSIASAKIRYVNLVNVDVFLNDFANSLSLRQVDLDASLKTKISENLWDLYD